MVLSASLVEIELYPHNFLFLELRLLLQSAIQTCNAFLGEKYAQSY